jgi:hypothetical protein
MISTFKTLFDIGKWARGDENPKVGREFGDLRKSIVLQPTGKYAEEVTPRLRSTALIQCFDQD